MSEGWQVEPRPARPELAEGFKGPTYTDPTPLRAGRDWVSLSEKLDADGWALLMRFGGTIGEPDAG